ncbi:MAG: DUF1330 domain-containing protein [Halofilum sp. (in: g-proteobacteria)]|nr:DUF1330 domain-containing protein [Halofilum sp. (in: g-proteobacteria)]
MPWRRATGSTASARSTTRPRWPSTCAWPARRSRPPAGASWCAGSPTRAFEAGLMQRTVVIEFDSVEAAIACYEGAAYGEALAALGDAAERDLRIVEGTQ